MTIKALFLDFYGTLVHEDDDIIPLICEQICQHAPGSPDVKEIGRHWWRFFSAMTKESAGESFRTQRELGLASLQETIAFFRSDCSAEAIIQAQFAHWEKPRLYEDTLPFLQQLTGLPAYILSNIDTSDVTAAAAHHGIQTAGILTSEDVRSYKPRPELFIEAMQRYGLGVREVIHIGDSLNSDVGGAGALGIRTVWLNRLNKPNPGAIRPDYTCRDLNEVKQMLRREFGAGA